MLLFVASFFGLCYCYCFWEFLLVLFLLAFNSIKKEKKENLQGDFFLLQTLTMSRFKFFELTEFCTGCRGCCSVRCFLVNDPFLVSTILRIVKNVVHSINFFTFYCLHRHDQGTTRVIENNICSHR
ncbi:hypothetical protein CsatA_003041 [Cannabis sativa]